MKKRKKPPALETKCQPLRANKMAHVMPGRPAKANGALQQIVLFLFKHGVIGETFTPSSFEADTLPLNWPLHVCDKPL